METAKVDLRKLQLLNDRIAQVIEALNQVRFSVHGLQHTPGYGPGVPTWGWSGMQPYPQQFVPQASMPNGINGLSHTGGDAGGIDPIIAQQLAARFSQPIPVPSAFPYPQAVQLGHPYGPQYGQTFSWAYGPGI